MSFKLTSDVYDEAMKSKYEIDPNSAVMLCIGGSRITCTLKSINDDKFKAILAQVGIDFEKNSLNKFFIFFHTFERVESGGMSEINDLVKTILPFVNAAISKQTNDQLNLSLQDLSYLVIKTAEDRKYNPSRRAYELQVTVTEEMVEKAKKAGLVFRELCTDPVIVYEAVREATFLQPGQQSKLSAQKID